jgi:hypothetical protein
MHISSLLFPGCAVTGGVGPLQPADHQAWTNLQLAHCHSPRGIPAAISDIVSWFISRYAPIASYNSHRIKSSATVHDGQCRSHAALNGLERGLCVLCASALRAECWLAPPGRRFVCARVVGVGARRRAPAHQALRRTLCRHPNDWGWYYYMYRSNRAMHVAATASAPGLARRGWIPWRTAPQNGHVAFAAPTEPVAPSSPPPGRQQGHDGARRAGRAAQRQGARQGGPQRGGAAAAQPRDIRPGAGRRRCR